MRLYEQPIDAVIYDVDGPLVEFFETLRDVIKLDAFEFGYPVERIDPYFAKCGTAEWAPSLIGGTLQMWPEMNGEQALKFCRHMRSIERGFPYKAQQGAIESLQKFRDVGAKLGICTTNDMGALQHRLDCIGIGLNWFHGKATYESAHVKPDPRALNVVLDEIGVPAERAVFIGDWESDFRVADGAGVTFIGLTSVQVSREKFSELGVPNCYIIDSMTQLPDLFKP